MQVTAQQVLEAIGLPAQDQAIVLRAGVYRRDDLIVVGTHFAPSAEQAVAWAQGHKDKNVFFGACPRFTKDGTKAGVKTVTCLWADLDGKDYEGGKEEALRVLMAFPIPPTVIIDSGNGYHAY
jgi:hypothetical protein